MLVCSPYRCCSLSYPLALKMAENTRLGGTEQHLQEFKNSFQVMINDLRFDMERKFENTNKRLQELNYIIQKPISLIKLIKVL